MKPTEYLVEETTGRWGAGPLEDWLNTKAEQGWRLVTTFWTYDRAHRELSELLFVFERRGSK